VEREVLCCLQGLEVMDDEEYDGYGRGVPWSKNTGTLVDCGKGGK